MATATPFEILAAADRVLEQERRELRAERRAFERFGDRVAELDVGGRRSAGDPPTGGSPTGLARARTPTGLTQVRRAYEQTVMAVPHYSGHDESTIESVAAELSEELAAAIDQESTLHPPLKRALLETTGRATRSRAILLEAVVTEREAVETAERNLRRNLLELDSLCKQPLSQLEGNALELTSERLYALRESCDQLAETRQRTLRQRREFPGEDGSLERYLYNTCSYTYPILAALGRFGTLLDLSIRYVDGRLELYTEQTH